LGSSRMPCTHGLIKGNPSRINDAVSSKLIELVNETATKDRLSLLASHTGKLRDGSDRNL
jgi:hypothetical protein